MKKLISALIIIFISVNISGCIEKKVTKSEEQAELTYRIKKLPGDLIADMDDSLSYLLFDGLFIEEEGNVRNSLCSSYMVSEENKCYNFSIRKGAVFSNGETITSEDFKTYFDYLKEKGLFNNVRSIKTPDINTLRIELKEEDKNFIKHISDPVFLLRNIDDLNIDIKSNYTNLHFSGPYNISYICENYILLKQNEDYYNKNLVNAGSIKVILQPLDEMALAMFDEGEIDILSCPIEEQSGKKITALNSVNVIFNSKDILNTEQEREGLIYQLKEKFKLREDQEWLQKALNIKEEIINNNLQYKDTVNILCQDKNCSDLAGCISDILSEKGYKTKVTDKEGGENQITVKYGNFKESAEVYPVISLKIYLYNKDAAGGYFDSRGSLILISANKKLP